MRIWVLKERRHFSAYDVKRFMEEAGAASVDLEIVSPDEFDIIATEEGCILRDGKPARPPDCLIPRIGSATTYFALAVVRQLQRLGVSVANSSSSIELAKDKLATIQELSAKGLPVPKTMLMKLPIDNAMVKREFSFPLIIKTVVGSHGKGVYLCRTARQFEEIMGLVESSRDSRANFIFQEFLSGSRGKDIRVMVLGGRPLGAMLRKAGEGKYEANFTAGGKVEGIRMDKAMQLLSIESGRVLGLDIAGVDLLFDRGGYSIAEVNSSPGFEGFEEATGINVAREILEFVKAKPSDSFKKPARLPG